MKNFTKHLFAFILFSAFCLTVKAQTNVSGGIYSNTTWTKANSPYIVTDTVVVFPGYTLTIEPGVTVKFADATRLEMRQALLIANGTNVDSITFTSNSLTPTLGIYSGVYLNIGSYESVFNFCNFQYANFGIYVTGNAGTDSTISIKNSTFTYNKIGVNTSWVVTNIDSCSFTNNNYGSFVDFGTISNCYFAKNQSGIFYANNIINCIVDSNQIGIKVDGSSLTNLIVKYNKTGVELGSRSVLDNCIINNNEIGINTTSGNTIKNCTIDSNSVRGALLMGNANVPLSFFNNQVKYNGIGISDTTNSRGYTITKNDIEDNYIGIILFQPQDTIYCNKICGNALYDLEYTQSANAYLIANNYWCTTDSATIAAHIYDGYDNFNYGLVFFMPIDSGACYLTGCNLHLSSAVINATCDTCHNGQARINVANGHPTITYTWFTSPIQYTQTATGLASGTYSVCVSDGNGCTACTTVFVDSSNCTGFGIVTNGTNSTCLLCNDGKAWVNVTNGSAPYSYTWYTAPIQNTDTAYNLLSGTYAVCVTDLYGCAACDSVTIGTGSCSAHFNLYPDTSIMHTYIAVNMASGAGTLSYDWDWGDGGAHAFTPFPSHTYAAAGFYKICLSITDTAGCTDTYCNSFYLLRSTNTMIFVSVISPGATGIKENTGNSSLYIFPNPASDNLTLIIPDNASKGTVKIFNLLGAITYSSAITKQKTDLDVSNLSKGIYIIEVTCGDSISRQKFVKE